METKELTREIEFRARDEENKEMLTSTTHISYTPIYEDRMVKATTYQDKEGVRRTRLKGIYGLIPLQYTGLKDKKGTKIYEGDIIQYDDNEDMSHWVSGETAVVISLPGRFTARMKPYDSGKYNNQNTLNEEFKDCISVIGNLYEHPSLLTDK